MSPHQTVLTLIRATGPVALPHSGVSPVPLMKLADPALGVMTDLTITAIFSIGCDVQIDQALLYMKAVGVRFLFVLDSNGKLVGLVTSIDILGEKPMRYLQSVDCTHLTCMRSDVFVKNVMTPVNIWEMIDYADVKKAQISQVVASFKATGRRHLVVTEGTWGASGNIVRGIFSASRVEQATGLQLEIVSTAKSFAEIEHALTRS